MKDLFTILTENEIEVPEEKKTAVKKAVEENYKTINEFNKKVEKLTTAEETIKDLNDKIGKIEADGTAIDELKQKVADYEKAEADRKDAEEKAKKTAALRKRFDGLKGDKEYVGGGDDGYIAKGIFGEFCDALSDEANQGKSDSEVYEAIIKDRPIFVNPNQTLDMPEANPDGNTEKPKFKNFF
jgi:hypothetical protein